mmetsp:Transcript_13693/g.18356  ORF Transcript_13693/g.18356 Transcript_13693/m.18356 type:complete len:360 (+) Transcript_13693:773-1852(+)
MTRDNETRSELESWLHTKGKFSESRWSVREKRSLKAWFNRIDADGSGEIDVEELADPLLSSGLAQTMDDVRELVRGVDEDGSGAIGFSEFLNIMRPKQQGNTRPTTSSSLSRDEKILMEDEVFVVPSQHRRCIQGAKKKKEDKWKETMLSDKDKQRQVVESRKMMDCAPDNPIARLQQMQEQNGDMDIKSVLSLKRRKLLLDATMGEAQRREKCLDEISKLKAEIRELSGHDKCRKLKDIANVHRRLDKAQQEKQHFVSAMKCMVERSLESVEEAGGSTPVRNRCKPAPKSTIQSSSFGKSRNSTRKEAIDVGGDLGGKKNVHNMLAKDTVLRNDTLGGRRAFLYPITSRNKQTINAQL